MKVAQFLQKKYGVAVNPASLFDIQVFINLAYKYNGDF